VDAKEDVRAVGDRWKQLGAAQLSADQVAKAYASYMRAGRAFLKLGLEREVAACDKNAGIASDRLGRSRRALELYGSARSAYLTHGASADVASCDLNAGIALRKLGEHRLALSHYQAARAVFVDSEDWIRVAQCDQNAAIVLSDLGQFDEAITRVSEARSVFQSNGLAVKVADCDINIGVNLRSKGDYEAALARYADARAVYVREDLTLKVAVCDINDGAALRFLGRAEEALARFAAARESYSKLGLPVKVAHCDFDIGTVLSDLERFRESLHHYQRARKVFARHGLRVDAADCDHNAGKALRGLGDYRAALRRYAAADATYRAMKLALARADTNINTGVALVRLGQTQAALDHYRAARRTYIHRHLPLQVAGCDLNIALAYSRDDQPRRALPWVLRALSVLSDYRYELSDARHRRTWGGRYRTAMETAASLANRLDRHDLVAELIETARVQGVPKQRVTRAVAEGAANSQPGIPSPSEVRNTSGDDESPELRAIRSAVGIVPLRPPPSIAIRRLSVLAAIRRTGGTNSNGPARDRDLIAREPDVVELERVLERVGGRDAWWWGTWVGTDVIRWSVIRSLGRETVVDTGEIDYSRGSAARTALETFNRSLPRPFESGPLGAARIQAGAFARPIDEHVLAQRLGAALVPPPLAAEFHQRAESGIELSLVVAPDPLLARIPFALLAVPDDGDGDAYLGRPPANMKRVIHGAVVRYAPSAALVAVLAKRTPPAPAAGLRALSVIVADPDGTLSTPVLIPADADEVLTSARELSSAAAMRGATVATKGALSRALRRSAARSDAVFAFVGHTEATQDGLPANAALRLAGNERVFAHEFFGTESALQFPMPSCVLLASCASSGADASEWLGLGPAMLWAGAQHAVTTLWPVPDQEVTAKFDARLIAALREQRDPAAALRCLQAEELERWSSSLGRTDSIGDADAGAADEMPSPVCWGSYIYLGFS
jgi:tetratricopeptide (TPR) repeat protein